MRNLHQMSASQAAQAIQKGQLKSEDLLCACIERITEKEAQTQAWVNTHFSAALEQARHLDRSAYTGILHGIPFGAKDLFDTHDFPTCYGSPIYQNNQPSTDAVHIALMRQAGGILLGKTVTTEFATFKGGPTTNPHNIAHTPGGSSSGSAAAVADYMIPLATGSQTAGSIIRPASFCGVIGYKPSFGKISLGGAKSLSPSLDTLGSFSRSVEDAALCVAAMTGDTALAQIPRITKPVRLGTCLTPDAHLASEETLLGIEHVRLIAEHVFKTTISEHILPPIFEKMSEIQGRIMWAESAKSFAFEQNNFPDQLSQQLKGLIKLGNNISYEQYTEDLKTAELARRILDDYLSHQVDILITPSAIGQAPQGLTQTGDPIFCRTWTLMGVPCISLPLYTSSEGLPVGIQLIAARGQDALLLAVADRLMKSQENA